MGTQQYQPFPNTHWSLVRRAGADGTHDRRQALSILLARYEPALKSYLRFVRHLGDESDDILQAFIADKLLEQEMLRHADENRGRFRTFLLTSLNNFVTSRYRSDGSRLRAAQKNAAKNPRPQPSPDQSLEAAWARTLIRDVLAAMQQKCLADGRPDLWRVFEARILAELFTTAAPVPYEILAAELHLASPTQAANLLVTAKRLYARLLRVAVSEYEKDEAHIEAEIADLRAILDRVPPSDSTCSDSLPGK